MSASSSTDEDSSEGELEFVSAARRQGQDFEVATGGVCGSLIGGGGPELSSTGKASGDPYEVNGDDDEGDGNCSDGSEKFLRSRLAAKKARPTPPSKIYGIRRKELYQPPSLAKDTSADNKMFVLSSDTDEETMNDSMKENATLARLSTAMPTKHEAEAAASSSSSSPESSSSGGDDDDYAHYAHHSYKQCLNDLPASALAESRKRRAAGRSVAAATSSVSADYLAKKLRMQQELERQRLKQQQLQLQQPQQRQFSQQFATVGDDDDDNNNDDDDYDMGMEDETPKVKNRRVPGQLEGAAAQQKLEKTRREKEERKLASDGFRKRERERKERERAAKRAAKDAEKAGREQDRARARQASGKHARDEIAVLMDPGLYHHPDLLFCQELRDLEYKVERFESLLGCPAIQWIRKDYLEGGADDAVKQLHAKNREGYVHLPTLAIVFDDPNPFIRMLERDDDDDNFPALEEWLIGIQAGWRHSWRYPETVRPRLVLLLHRVPQQLMALRNDFQAQRNGVTNLPPCSEELQDAIAWLMVQFHVECVTCSEFKYLNLEITKMTRILSEEPYQRVYADFDCIGKLNRNCDMDAPRWESAKSTWMNQIQQLQGVSFDMAREFVRHYPTARSLWLAYQSEDLTEDEKRLLAAELFGERRLVKLSDQLYRLFTTNNPEEII
jgi:hypothetical protein